MFEMLFVGMVVMVLKRVGEVVCWDGWMVGFVGSGM